MKINRYFTAALLFVATAATVMSCSEDVTGGEVDRGLTTVTFGVSMGEQPKAATRATTDGKVVEHPAMDREKKITGKLVAVTYRDNRIYNTYEADPVASGDDAGKYKIDFALGGSYDMYLFANPGTDLRATMLDTAKISTPEKLFAQIETRDPGADNTATDFFMTSAKVAVIINAGSATGTDLGVIDLTRAVSRIDIDASKVDGFLIESVTFKNRYKTSLVARTTVGTGMGISGLVKEDKVYDLTVDDGNGGKVGVPKDTARIYGFENLVTADTYEGGTTVLNIKAKFDGIEIDRDVVFENIPLQRNYLYKVILQPKDPVDEFKELQWTFQVVDWSTGEVLQMKGDDLVNRDKPDFKVTAQDGLTITGANGEGNNPTDLYCSTHAARDIEVVVDGSSSTTSKLICTDPIEGYAGTPYTITQEKKEFLSNGHTKITYKIHLDENTMKTSDRLFHFAVENGLKASDKHNFTVHQPADWENLDVTFFELAASDGVVITGADNEDKNPRLVILPNNEAASLTLTITAPYTTDDAVAKLKVKKGLLNTDKYGRITISDDTEIAADGSPVKSHNDKVVKKKFTITIAENTSETADNEYQCTVIYGDTDEEKYIFKVQQPKKVVPNP